MNTHKVEMIKTPEFTKLFHEAVSEISETLQAMQSLHDSKSEEELQAGTPENVRSFAVYKALQVALESLKTPEGEPDHKACMIFASDIIAYLLNHKHS